MVRETLEAKGLNLLVANGRAAFQTVFHYHVHVIPRYSYNELNLPWISRAGDRTRIAEAAASLREALEPEP